MLHIPFFNRLIDAGLQLSDLGDQIVDRHAQLPSLDGHPLELFLLLFDMPVQLLQLPFFLRKLPDAPCDKVLESLCKIIALLAVNEICYFI